jgi:peptidoglycan/LPS O-acetylase OafA/YrhL
MDAKINLHHPYNSPDIDGLRALPVLLVFFLHAFPNWEDAGYFGKGGFIGVAKLVNNFDFLVAK